MKLVPVFGTLLVLAFPAAVAAQQALGPSLDLSHLAKQVPQRVELDIPGVFHIPVRGQEFKRFDVAAVAGRTYSRLFVAVDFTVGPFHRNNRGAAHNVLQVIRHPRWQGNVMQYLNYFPKSTIFKNTNNYDQRAGQINRTDTRYRLQIGHTYTVETVFDHRQRARVVRLLENGVVLRELRDKHTGPLRFDGRGDGVDGPGIMIAFGHRGNERGGEEATYGWSYGNLRVRLEP